MSRRGRKEPQGQLSAVGIEDTDPRMEDVIRTLEEIGHIMGMQAQKRAAAFARAAEVAATTAVNGNNASLGQG